MEVNWFFYCIHECHSNYGNHICIKGIFREQSIHHLVSVKYENILLKINFKKISKKIVELLWTF